MNIIYNINLEDYQSVRKRDYLNFSTIEISNNLLLGTVAFVDSKKDNGLFFEAEMLKFFIDIYDALIKLKSKKLEDEIIFSMYQSYMFKLELEKKYLILTFNKNLVLRYDYKDFLSEIKKNMRRVYSDFKILFDNYKSIENIDFLVDKFESLK